MKERVESLRAHVLLAAVAPEPTAEGLRERPVFLMAGHSELGLAYGPRIVEECRRVVATVTDVSNGTMIHGIPCWNSEEFLLRARQYPRAIALDFAASPNARGWVAQLCEEAGVERCDCVMAQAQFGLHAVYEPVSIYRQQTLDRLDNFLKLADRLDDDFSRASLFGNLLFRLTYDRDHIVRSSRDEEYFSGWADTNTFRLGTREHFVDCGAYQGPIVAKFLGATGHRYASITAFEPDHLNFEKLQKLTPYPLHDYQLINKAVSSKREKLKFKQTGTVSSSFSSDGDVEVETVRLDDELDKLTFLKMDVEGSEPDALQGALRLLRTHRPRAAVCVYHYALDLLRVMDQFDAAVEDYHFRLRHHFGGYYYDLVLYASPVSGIEPPAQAT